LLCLPLTRPRKILLLHDNNIYTSAREDQDTEKRIMQRSSPPIKTDLLTAKRSKHKTHSKQGKKTRGCGRRNKRKGRGEGRKRGRGGGGDRETWIPFLLPSIPVTEIAKFRQYRSANL